MKFKQVNETYFKNCGFLPSSYYSEGRLYAYPCFILDTRYRILVYSKSMLDNNLYYEHNEIKCATSYL